MSEAETLFEPSSYVATDAHGLLCGFEPGTRTLSAGYRVDPRFRALPIDIVFEKDVAVTLRDGVTIYVDVLRPAGTERVPVIVAWSPYGKSQGTAPSVTNLFGMLGMDNGALSGLEKFEGPDPAYWCAQGYAICNPDPRGIAQSEGDSAMFGRQEGKDCHDLIEWLAVQDWCNGKVAMSGTSYLAISQWFTAAEQPPHLAAINPWEGAQRRLPRSRHARRHARHRLRRTAADTATPAATDARTSWRRRERYPLIERAVGRQDRPVRQGHRACLRRRQLLQHAAHRGHVPGLAENRFRGEVAAHPQHAGMARLLRRGECRGSAPVLRSLLEGRGQWLGTDAARPVQRARSRRRRPDRSGGGRVPPDGVTDTQYYLDGASRTLTAEAPRTTVTAATTSEANPGLVSFAIRFDEETTMVGYPKARLWVEADGADDMDLFVLVQKLDRNGTPLQQFTVPNHGALMQDLTERAHRCCGTRGPNGPLARVRSTPGPDVVDRCGPRAHLRPDREAEPRRDRRRRNRPVPNRSGVPSRRSSSGW